MPNNKNKPSFVSIIIPVFNEEDNIAKITEQIMAVMPYPFEILFIDDGSTDNTLDTIRNLSTIHPELGYISFSRNFGHQIAIKAGLDHANGDCVITMDGDLQHPPQLILKMLKMWEDGADVVHTRRLSEKKQPFFKKYASQVFYRVLNSCASIHVEPGTADFRLLDARIVNICRELHEDNFFWRGLIPWLGFNQQFLDYTPQPRLHGSSKYTMRKMLRLAWDGISSFSLLPLRFATMLGAIFFTACLLYGLYVFICIALGDAVSGWGSLMVAILAIGSIQMIFLGILGEYIGKIFMSTKRRPLYLTKEIQSPSIREDVHE